jgi:hypothetical protein
MSSSLEGSDRRGSAVRMKRSLAGPAGCATNDGSQRVAGDAEDGGENLRGPTRRSYNGAIELRQLPAAVSRSAVASSNCTSFSASANVAVDTGGPAFGAVPKAGGAPGGRDVDSGVGLRHAARTAMNPVEARFRKRRREFGMSHCSDLAA